MRKYEGAFWSDENVLYIGLCGSYIGYIQKEKFSCTVKNI